VGGGGQCPQPGHHRAGPVGQDGELAAHTHPQDRPQQRTGTKWLARPAEQRRQVHAVTGLEQLLGEGDHARVDAGGSWMTITAGPLPARYTW
jgi:hypothetical protein